MEYLGVNGNFLVGFEVRGIGRDKDVDTGFLLFSVRCSVGGRGLAEEPLAVFHGEFPHSLV